MIGRGIRMTSDPISLASLAGLRSRSSSASTVLPAIIKAFASFMVVLSSLDRLVLFLGFGAVGDGLGLLFSGDFYIGAFDGFLAGVADDFFVAVQAGEYLDVIAIIDAEGDRLEMNLVVSSTMAT